MVGFSWNHWLSGFGLLGGDQRRKPRRVRNARIEVLEDRALLTANLPVAVNDVFAVAADTTLNGSTVLANDTDADGDTISQAQLQSNVSHGSLTLNTDGTFTYVPTTGFIGTDSFTYLAIDSANSETSLTSATVTIHVGTVNSLPVATPATINATTDTAFHGTLTGTDANGDPLTFAAGATASTNGTVVIDPDGSFIFTPTAGFTGVGSFSFTANDGTGNSTEATVTVNIGPAGASVAPIAAPLTIVTPVDVTFNGNLTATDANGDPLTFTAGAVAAANGTVTIGADGSFSYVPDAGFTGTDSFSFVANDGALTSTDTLVTVHVGVTNVLPVVGPVSLSSTTDTVVTGTLTGTDANGDPLTFSVGSTAATNGSVVINPDGTFTFTPTAGFNGIATFSYNANDGIADGADGIVTITIAPNIAPVSVAQTITTAVNTTFNGTLTATDANGDTLTFAAGADAAANGTVTINPDGTFSYVPDAGFTGTDSFSFTASDGTAISTESVVTVHVGIANSLPVVSPISLTTGTDTAVSGTLTATDANGDPLTFSAGATAATNGTVVINPDGTFTFTPTAGFNGVATFSYRANDGLGNSTDAIATITVGANVGPISTAQTISTAVDTTFTGTLTATDANGDALTFAAGTVAAANGTVTINPDGTFSYVPDAGFTGVDSFSFTASDGVTTSAESLVTVHVGITNSLPVVLPVTLSTNTNTALTGTLTGTDANGDPLTFSEGATAETNGTVVINPDGTFTFTPTAGFNGVASFSYRANDGIGNSTDATVTVNVSAVVNVAPVGVAQTITTATDTTFNGTLIATDSNGDPLTFAAGTVAAANGTVTINANGSFTYVPDAGFTGVDSFSFTASDGSLVSGDTLMTVHVGIANSLPVVSPITLSTTTSTPISGTLTATDANGDPLTFSEGATAETNGTVVINPDGTFTFTPTAGFNGVATFSYRANDGLGNSTDATATVNVSAVVNTAPVVNPITVNTTTGVAVNGQLTATDAEGDTLTFAEGSIAATNGTVVINPNGTFTFTPTAGFTGIGTFSFTASDGSLTSTNGVGTVVINAVANTAPVVINGTGTTSIGTALNGSVSPLATDAEGNPLTFAVGTQPTNGTLTLNGDGTFVYTPNAGFTGSDSFTFTASDGSLTSNVGTFNVTVNASVAEFTLDLAANATMATRLRSVTPLDASATLSNVVAGTSFANASIDASIISGGDSRKDQLLVIKRGGAVNVRGKRVFVNGSEVARISGGRRGQALHVQFNSGATEDSVNAVLQRIAARTRRNSPADVRTIQVSVTASDTTATDTILATKV